MKILHFIDEIRLGGAQTHLLTILRELRISYPKDKHIVVVLFEDDAFSDNFRNIGVNVYCLNLRPLFQTKSFLKVFKEISSFIKQQQPHIVESHLTWSRLFANTAAYYNNVKKRIGFEHGDIYLTSIFFKAANCFTQIYFQKIIVCSEFLKKWFHKTHKIRNKRIEVIHNCVSLNKFRPVEKKNLQNIIKDIPHIFTFITVGTLGRGVNKRVDISIKAMAVLKDRKINANLVICGDGDQRQELEMLTEKLNLKDKVFFLGLRNDVESIISHCDAFVHTAPSEPFGIVCLEAMASGIPVIIPNSGGIAEIITNNYDGIVYTALSPEQLSLQMEQLILSPELGNLLKNNALETVKKFDVSCYVKYLYNNFYN